MPSGNLNPYAVVKALLSRVHAQYVEGVQRIGQLWRIYVSSIKIRVDLLTKRTLIINGKLVPLYEQNPFITHQKSPEDRKDKLTVRGLPLSVSNKEIKTLLESQGVILASAVKYSLMRDEDGSLTDFKNGDRYVYCQRFHPPIPKQQKVCGMQCTIYHHGKTTTECKACNIQGHRPGDDVCEAKAEEGTIQAFRGYQHPLSNHYSTPIRAFGVPEPFKSVEHAWFWKMASDLGKHELATQIKDAEHAGKAKYLSKEMEENTRIAWEDENMDVMKDLLVEKSKSCELFRNCLLENHEKFLGECTQNLRWGTGMSKWMTEHTNVRFWPGNNLLGRLLMSITEELLTSQGDFVSHQTDNAHSANSANNANSAHNQEQDKTAESNVMEIEQAASENSNFVTQENYTSHNVPHDVVQAEVHNEPHEPSQEKPQDQSISHRRGSKPGIFNSSSVAEGDSKKKSEHKALNQGNKSLIKSVPARRHKSSTRDASRHRTSSTSKGTQGKHSIPDIRDFIDEKSGKRKTQETTPEKQPLEKKSNSTCS